MKEINGAKLTGSVQKEKKRNRIGGLPETERL
jgi:hypothetical protein